MTGELTLSGRILPVGGIKEKILAAKAAGIKTVIFPAKNSADISVLEEDLTKGLRVITASEFKEIPGWVFCR